MRRSFDSREIRDAPSDVTTREMLASGTPVPVRAVHQQVLQRLRVVARERVEPDGHVEHAVAVEELRHGAAPHGRLDRVVRVGHRDAVGRERRAIELESQLRLAKLLLHAQVRHAAHLGHHGLDLLGLPLQHLEVGPKHLHHQLALHAGQGLVHVVLDVLREVHRR